MTIAKLDKPTLQALRPRIDAALADLSIKLGVELKLGNGTFMPDGLSASFKLNLQVLGTDPKRARGEADFKQYGLSLFGLHDEWLGKDVVIQGKKLTIIGLDMSKRGEKCVMLESEGKRYTTTADSIRAKFGLPPFHLNVKAA